MAENVVINFVADTTALNSTIDLLEKLGTITKETADAFRKATKIYQEQGAELSRIAELEKKLSNEQSKNQKIRLKNLEDQNSSLNNLSKTLLNVAKTIGIAFGVHEVIAFGKACVSAFNEAELNAKKLSVAVSVNGGLAGDFGDLFEQSSQLQKIGIFSDDQIQQIQTAGLQFGLTADQVKKLTPIVADFAAATGQDLSSAMDAVLRGTEGAARGLKLYGISIKDGATSEEQLANITDQLTEKFKGQNEIIGETSVGAVNKLKNSFDDLKETLGSAFSSFLTPLFKGLNTAVKAITDPIDSSTIEGISQKADLLAKEIAKNEPVLKKTAAAFHLIGDSELKTKTVGFLTEYLKKVKELSESKPSNIISPKTIQDANDQLAKIQQLIQDGNKKQEQLRQENLDARKKQDDEAAKFEEVRFKISNDNLTKFIADQKKLIANDSTKDQGEKETAITNLKLLEYQLRIENQKRFNKDSSDLEQQLADQLLSINQKAADEDLKANVQSSKLAAALAVKAAKEQFLAKGDFSEAAQKELNDKIEKINTDASKKQSDLITDQTATSEAEVLTTKTEAAEAATDVVQTEIEKQIQLDKDKAAQQEKVAQLEVELAQRTASALTDIFFNGQKQQADIRIAQIEAQRGLQNEQLDAELAALDIQEQKAEGTYKKKTALEQRFADQKKEIENKKVQNELAAQKKINEEKHKTDVATRAQALANIAIQTAVTVMTTTGQAGFVPGGLLIPLIIALGALEAGAVLSTTLPKYHEGKLGQRMIGAEYPAMVLPQETIFDPEKSEAFHPTFKAIFDGKIKAPLLNDFVNFTLKPGDRNYSSNFSIDYSRLAREFGLELKYNLRGESRGILSKMNEMVEVLTNDYDPRFRG